ncbi:MAG: hypothetical protein QFE16_07760 [Pseudomonadota bacterium]|nr:hypothetical protein [Pseudomonadota bacterium]
MKPCAAFVRVVVLCALTVPIWSAAHSAARTDGIHEFRQARLDAPQSTAHAPTAVAPSFADRTSAFPAPESSREAGPAPEPDAWTLLAGSVGLVIFVALRRL